MNLSEHALVHAAVRHVPAEGDQWASIAPHATADAEPYCVPLGDLFLGASVLMVSNYSIYLLSLFHPVLLVRIAFYRLNRVTSCPHLTHSKAGTLCLGTVG
jgi:hypothetical protein